MTDKLDTLHRSSTMLEHGMSVAESKGRRAAARQKDVILKWYTDAAPVKASSSESRLPLDSSLLKVKGMRQLCDRHPVLRLALYEEDLTYSQPLRAYIHEQIMDDERPTRLTQFCRDYLEHRVREFYRTASAHHVDLVRKLSHARVLDNLGYAALHTEFINEDAITSDFLFSLFPDARSTYDLQGFLMGLVTLYPDSKDEEYLFSERFLQRYLVARYIFRVLQRRKSNLYIVNLNNKPLRACAAKFHATEDIWMMTLAMMAADDDLRPHRWSICEEVISLCKPALSPQYKLMFNLQVAFESGEPSSMRDQVDQLTHNQTADLSNLHRHPPRLLYCVHVLGYMVACSDNLYGLNLSHYGLNSENIQHLVEPSNAISEHSIQVLNLSYNPLGTSGLKRMHSFLVKASNLTSLDVSSCGIGDDGLEVLSGVLMCMPLQALKIRDNGITEVSGSVLLRRIHHCSMMRTLDLSANLLNDSWLRLFLHQLAALPALCAVDLRNNCLSETGRRKLQDLLIQRDHTAQGHQLHIYHVNQKPIPEPAVSDLFTETDEELTEIPVKGHNSSVGQLVVNPLTCSGDVVPDEVINETSAPVELYQSFSEYTVDVSKLGRYGVRDVSSDTNTSIGVHYGVQEVSSGTNTSMVGNSSYMSLGGMSSGDACRRPRKSIGGGPLERLRTIERSVARQSLKPNRSSNSLKLDCNSRLSEHSRCNSRMPEHSVMYEAQI